MQKLRVVVLDKMIDAKLTALEVDMMIYLSRYQDDTGSIPGVYYRNVCTSTGMSNQSFYNVLRSLTAKGLISMKKNSPTDYDICILDNDCSNYKAIGQYVNTNQKMFYSDAFAKMKGTEKLLAIFFLLRCGENHGGFRLDVEKFIEKLTEKFEIKKRMLILYLKQVKEFFSIGRKDNKYYVHVKKATTERCSSENKRLNVYLVKAACRRLGIKDASNAEINDTADLLSQYRKEIKKKNEETQNAPSIYDAIRGSLAVMDEPDNVGDSVENGAYRLRPKLVHKVLRTLLGLEHYREYMYSHVPAWD